MSAKSIGAKLHSFPLHSLMSCFRLCGVFHFKHCFCSATVKLCRCVRVCIVYCTVNVQVQTPLLGTSCSDMVMRSLSCDRRGYVTLHLIAAGLSGVCVCVFELGAFDGKFHSPWKLFQNRLGSTRFPRCTHSCPNTFTVP